MMTAKAAVNTLAWLRQRVIAIDPARIVHVSLIARPRAGDSLGAFDVTVCFKDPHGFNEEFLEEFERVVQREGYELAGWVVTWNKPREALCVVIRIERGK